MKNCTVAIVLFFLFSTVSPAAEYHVAGGAAGAADTNPGTAGKPWKTIAKAAAVAQPGDVVLIHAGRYAESVAIRNAGTADHPIRFKPSPTTPC